MSSDPIAVIVLGEREDWADVLIITKSTSGGFNCQLRDQVLGGHGESIEGSITNFALSLEGLAKRVRSKSNVRNCPTCGRLKNELRDQFCDGSLKACGYQKPVAEIPIRACKWGRCNGVVAGVVGKGICNRCGDPQ